MLIGVIVSVLGAAVSGVSVIRFSFLPRPVAAFRLSPVGRHTRPLPLSVIPLKLRSFQRSLPPPAVGGAGFTSAFEPRQARPARPMSAPFAASGECRRCALWRSRAPAAEPFAGQSAASHRNPPPSAARSAHRPVRPRQVSGLSSGSARQPRSMQWHTPLAARWLNCGGSLAS